MKDIKELRSLTIEQLQDEIFALRKEQFKLRMNKANGLPVKSERKVRRSIARVKTIKSEKVGKSHGE